MVVVVVVAKMGTDEEGVALPHRHGNRTYVFVRVSLSNICQPPNYRLLLLRRTQRAGLTAKVNVLAAQNEDEEDPEAAVRHKDWGRGETGRLDLTQRSLLITFQKKN